MKTCKREMAGKDGREEKKIEEENGRGRTKKKGKNGNVSRMRK